MSNIFQEMMLVATGNWQPFPITSALFGLSSYSSFNKRDLFDNVSVF